MLYFTVPFYCIAFQMSIEVYLPVQISQRTAMLKVPKVK